MFFNLNSSYSSDGPTLSVGNKEGVGDTPIMVNMQAPMPRL